MFWFILLYPPLSWTILPTAVTVFCEKALKNFTFPAQPQMADKDSGLVNIVEQLAAKV